MSMGNETNDPRADAKNAQAAACGCCLAGAVILIVFWALSVWLFGLIRHGLEREASYPDPVCERCGNPLDGSHAGCFEENDCWYAATLIVARGTGGP